MRTPLSAICQLLTPALTEIDVVTDQKVPLAVDIGGTFTDVAIAVGDRFVTAKIPTTPLDPVQGVMDGIATAIERAGLTAGHIGSVVHGTTLATNALIERSGATVGLITTEGFRDVLEIAYERRYDQYDIFLDKPDMIVPRRRCLTVKERVDADGQVHQPLDESSLDAVLAGIDDQQVESIAVGLLHSYANPAHEQRVRDWLAARRPELAISLSCEVCPEIREFDRLCTTVANAYIKPLMGRYLIALADALREGQFDCPLFIITSGGGMTTVDTAVEFPIRLVESGPSGGAILSAQIAKQCGLDHIVSFDMGGTTAKVCLIDHGQPQTSRQFEVARAARFMKGSGLPIRIPVIEMIEIGAGGGSISSVDSLGRITVGPRSAGAEPGPACYRKGGEDATVTDADVALGYVDPDAFAEGRLRLDPERAQRAIKMGVADLLHVSAADAAYGISQIVDENMANAARIHAVERGTDLGGRTMVAFGGNGPLHATRVAERIGVSRILVPPDPGVGSAVGFLSAPVSYEIVSSLYVLLDQIEVSAINRLFQRMETQASAVVRAAAPEAPLEVRRSAFMRYRGQGHEIEVPVPSRELEARDFESLRAAYDERYAALFGRVVPEMVIEIMNWSSVVSTEPVPTTPVSAAVGTRTPESQGARTVHVGYGGETVEARCYLREELGEGDRIEGPALIVEAQTTTYVSPDFTACVDGVANIVLSRHETNGV